MLSGGIDGPSFSGGGARESRFVTVPNCWGSLCGETMVEVRGHTETVDHCLGGLCGSQDVFIPDRRRHYYEDTVSSSNLSTPPLVNYSELGQCLKVIGVVVGVYATGLMLGLAGVALGLGSTAFFLGSKLFQNDGQGMDV